LRVNPQKIIRSILYSVVSLHFGRTCRPMMMMPVTWR
jgi:hypothetical protein